MKRKQIIAVIIVLIIVFVIILGFSDVRQYKRIGDTNFYLVETMANSSNGKPIPGLFYSGNPRKAGFAGVSCMGVPSQIFWNDRYLVLKCTDRDSKRLINYCIIRYSKSIFDDPEDNYEVYEYATEIEYNEAMDSLGLSEPNMEQTDNHIPWTFIF